MIDNQTKAKLWDGGLLMANGADESVVSAKLRQIIDQIYDDKQAGDECGFLMRGTFILPLFVFANRAKITDDMLESLVFKPLQKVGVDALAGGGRDGLEGRGRWAIDLLASADNLHEATIGVRMIVYHEHILGKLISNLKFLAAVLTFARRGGQIDEEKLIQVSQAVQPICSTAIEQAKIEAEHLGGAEAGLVRELVQLLQDSLSGDDDIVHLATTLLVIISLVQVGLAPVELLERIEEERDRLWPSDKVRNDPGQRQLIERLYGEFLRTEAAKKKGEDV